MNFNTAARFNRAGIYNSFPYYVVAKESLDLMNIPGLLNIRVKQSIQDAYPQCDVTIDGYYPLNISSIAYAVVNVPDHTGTTQTVFSGIVPRSEVSYDPANDQTRITGYGAGWYLTRRHVPESLLHVTASHNPAMTIRKLLGDDEWAMLTGMEPYIILPVSAWGTLLSAKTFDWSRTTTIAQAIQQIADYGRFIWTTGSHGGSPAGFFFPEDAIDTYADIPAPVTFDYDNPYVDAISTTTEADEMVNSVFVIGRSPAGGTISSAYQSPSVTQGDEIPIEMVEPSGAFTTQLQVNARTTELYDQYSTPVQTFSATIGLRTDLRLYQLIRFTNLAGVYSGWQRISDITYDIKPADYSVEIEFLPKEKFINLKDMYRFHGSSAVDEVSNIFGSLALQMPTNEAGTVTAIDQQNNRATVLLDDGRVIEGDI